MSRNKREGFYAGRFAGANVRSKYIQSLLAYSKFLRLGIKIETKAALRRKYIYVKK